MDAFIEFVRKYKKEIIIVSSTALLTFLLCFVVFSLIAKNKPQTKTTQTIQKTNSITYVGSKNSDKYHLTSCKWAANIKSSNKITFSSENQARTRGYTPCRTCLD